MSGAFGAPTGFIWSYSPDRRFSSVAATDRGLVALDREFGGGRGLTTSGVRNVEQGLRNLLAHGGPSRLMESKRRGYYADAPEAWLFEPAVELGDRVRAGQLCGRVHFFRRQSGAGAGGVSLRRRWDGDLQAAFRAGGTRRLRSASGYRLRGLDRNAAAHRAGASIWEILITRRIWRIKYHPSGCFFFLRSRSRARA